MTDIASSRLLGAERMRRHRYLRKVGLKSIPVQLHDHEIEGLVATGLLQASERQDQRLLQSRSVCISTAIQFVRCEQ